MAKCIECFDIREHVVNASHLRSYPRSCRDEATPLKLHVKQYIPREDSNAGTDAVTIVAASGIGFPKVRQNTRNDRTGP